MATASQTTDSEALARHSANLLPDAVVSGARDVPARDRSPLVRAAPRLISAQSYGFKASWKTAKPQLVLILKSAIHASPSAEMSLGAARTSACATKRPSHLLRRLFHGF